MVKTNVLISIVMCHYIYRAMEKNTQGNMCMAFFVLAFGGSIIFYQLFLGSF